jgi:hypothetical protein
MSSFDSYEAGTPDIFIDISVVVTATGAAKTDLVYNTSGMSLWYQVGNGAITEVAVGGSPAPTSMTAGGTHVDWGFYHIGQGDYKVGIPDALGSAQGKVRIWLTFVDCKGFPAYIDLTGYDKTAIAAGAATTADITSLMSYPASGPVERSPDDTNSIAFDWPVSGATITAEVSLDNASYVSTAGSVSFLRTEDANHYYTLSYNVADRPVGEGTARYKFVDGTYTFYAVLRVEGVGTDPVVVRSAMGLASANLDTQLSTITSNTTSTTHRQAW